MAYSTDNHDTQSIRTEFTAQNYHTMGNDETEQENSRARKLARIKLRGFYNVDEGIEYIGIGKYHYIWMLLYGVSSMTQAVEVTLSSVILSELACYWNLTLLEQVLIPSLVLVAAIPGDYVGGWLGDIYGRKPILIIGQLIIAVFGVISAFCTTYISFLLVRCMVGFGFGMVTMLVIVQVAELCPTAYRASAVSVTFIMWAVGDCYIVFGAWLLQAKYGWQAVVLWAAIPCVLLCFVLPFADESPKFLAISNQQGKAQVILHKIAACNKVDMCPGDLEGVEETRRGKVADMFQPEYIRTTICLIVAMFMANYLYMGNIFDSPYLLDTGYCFGDVPSEDSCIFTDEELEYTLIICLGEFVSVPLFAVLSELLGRIRAANILTACLLVIIITCCFCFGETVLIIELFVTRAFSNASLLLLYIYTPESYPTYMRSIGFGVVMLFCNMGGVCAVFTVYMVGLSISWAYMFWMFIAAAVVLTITTLFFDVETVGKRLSDNRADSSTPIRWHRGGEEGVVKGSEEVEKGSTRGSRADEESQRGGEGSQRGGEGSGRGGEGSGRGGEDENQPGPHQGTGEASPEDGDQIELVKKD